MTRFPTTVAQNGPPPAAAAGLYRGTVMHQRFVPVAHRFAYRVFAVVVDITRLDQADRQSRLFSINRFNLVSVHESDHGRRDGSPLADHVRGLMTRDGVAVDRILMLCYPRILGYVFNPLTVYFGYDRDARLRSVVYEVSNTFGESHSYVCPVAAEALTPAGLRQHRPKTFHVSPFLGMDLDYHFRVLPPGRAVRIRIHETGDGRPVLAATFAGRHRRLDTAGLLGACLSLPLMTLKVIAAIHFEAARLWFKGLGLVPRPHRSQSITFEKNDPAAAAARTTTEPAEEPAQSKRPPVRAA